ncbi:uncharacterized protein FFNC_15568 [Fusarium fujikuroi]|nr:uncharacterized protein FFNC_15568 [Fusarium fujikuroi]
MPDPEHANSDIIDDAKDDEFHIDMEHRNGIYDGNSHDGIYDDAFLELRKLVSIYHIPSPASNAKRAPYDVEDPREGHLTPFSFSHGRDCGGSSVDAVSSAQDNEIDQYNWKYWSN